MHELWSKYGLSSCSFSDKMTLVEHMQILVGNGNSPKALIGCLSCTPLIPIAPGFSWQCDLGQMKIFRTMLCSFVSKLVIIYNMQLCGFHYITWYSICIMVIFPMYFYCFGVLPCVPQGVPVPNKCQMSLDINIFVSQVSRIA